MFRNFMRTAVVLIGFILTLNVAARALGGLKAPNRVMAGFTMDCEDIPQPCWNGIVPGATTAEEQIRRMKDSGYIPVQTSGLVASYRNPAGSLQHCQRVIFLRGRDRSNEITVQEIFLSRCPDMQSGHVMSIFQQPALLSNKAAMLLYRNGAVRAIFAPSSRWQVSTFETVQGLRMRANSTLPLYQWHGFVYPWRYCQLEPDAAGCET